MSLHTALASTLFSFGVTKFYVDDFDADPYTIWRKMKVMIYSR